MGAILPIHNSGQSLVTGQPEEVKPQAADGNAFKNEKAADRTGTGGSPVYTQASDGSVIPNHNSGQSLVTGAEAGVKPDDVLHQRAAGGGVVMGSYTPGENPVIRIMRAHDETTLTHELGHHTWHLFRDLAADPSASSLSRARWLALERNYGVEPGGEWSRAQLEAFADDFVARYFVGHNEPPRQLAALFASMRESVLDMFEAADSAGLRASEATRSFLDRALSVSMREGQYRFGEALADINTRRWELAFVDERDLGPARSASGLDSPRRLEVLAREAGEDLEREMARLETARPELAAEMRGERARELAEFESQRRLLAEQAALMDDLVMCYL